MIELLFLLFAAVALGSALNVLVQKHVLYSSLSLILLLTSISALFILMQAEFLAVINVIVYAGAIMLWMFQRVVWGEVTNPQNESLADLNVRERLTMVPLLILIVWMGVYSNHFLRPMDTSVASLLNRVQNSQSNDVRTAERISR